MKNFEESAEIVGSIDDLLIEILLRLPIKSLIRFKIVSKHWHSLITNPLFCRHRSSNNNSAAVGLFLPLPDSLIFSFYEYIPFSPPKKNSTVKKLFRHFGVADDVFILQSCNGLFLCCNCFGEITYYVYNPCTNQYSALPKPDNGHICAMSLAFDPAKSPDHHKLVCFSDLGSGHYQIHVYSSKTGAWRITGAPFAVGEVYFATQGVYWNGAIHWIGSPREDAHSLYFDFDHDILEQIPNPPNHTTHDYYFGESSDHLHYFQIPRRESNFNVYEMKSDLSEWFVKYHVDLSLVANPEMIRAYCDRTDQHYKAFSIFCMVRGEDEANSFLVLKTAGKAVRYNLVSKTFEKLCDLQGVEVGDSIYFGEVAFQYIESLCCI